MENPPFSEESIARAPALAKIDCNSVSSIDSSGLSEMVSILDMSSVSLTTSVEIPKRLGSGFILVCSFFGELMTTGELWTSTEGKRAPILPGDDPGLKYPGDPTDALPLKYISF